jgi:hypothetical protein
VANTLPHGSNPREGDYHQRNSRTLSPMKTVHSTAHMLTCVVCQDLSSRFSQRPFRFNPYPRGPSSIRNSIQDSLEDLRRLVYQKKNRPQAELSESGTTLNFINIPAQKSKLKQAVNKALKIQLSTLIQHSPKKSQH